MYSIYCTVLYQYTVLQILYQYTYINRVEFHCVLYLFELIWCFHYWWKLRLETATRDLAANRRRRRPSSPRSMMRAAFDRRADIVFDRVPTNFGGAFEEATVWVKDWWLHYKWETRYTRIHSFLRDLKMAHNGLGRNIVLSSFYLILFYLQ